MRQSARVSVGRLGVWLLGLVVLTSACEAGSVGSSSNDIAAAGRHSESSLSPIPGGDQALLTIGMFGWDHPAIWLPRDLHTIVLYPDGTLTRIETRTSTSLAMYSTTLSAMQVDGLLAAADRAGLGDGLVLPTEPSPHEVIDGGWTVFTRRSDHGVGRVLVDQVGAEDGKASNARRGTLAELVGMVPQRDEGVWQETPIERWVVESAQPLTDLTAVDWPWPEVDSSGLAWEYNSAGVRCTIVTKPNWEYTYEEASNNSGALTSGMFRRPLLPGESGCDDVFAWREVLGFADSMFVALPNHQS